MLHNKNYNNKANHSIIVIERNNLKKKALRISPGTHH
jgi:hypothetical protein